MGCECFRPTRQRNQPVYITSLNKAMVDAQKIFQQKKQQRQKIIDDIIANQNQKGNLKKLFQHLGFHQGKVIDAIKQCNRRVSFDKTFSSVVIASMFCKLLVKMISTKKLKLYLQTINQQSNPQQLQSKRNLNINSSHGLRNLIYQLQSYFFQLVIKILVYSKQKKIHDTISEIMIQYTNACGDKLVAKKQLKSILDLYLNVVFQKNIQLINKKSFLPFFSYSMLLSKSKSQLFTSQFIDHHFNFILKIFFQLQDSKASSTSFIETQDFNLFEDSIESIIKQFILLSLQNKNIKQHVLTEIMQQGDNEKFSPKKMFKLQVLIRQNLNSYSCEHFMMDWLVYMLRYIGKKVDNENESIRQSLLQSMHETSIQAAIASYGSLKTNVVSTQSKANAIDALYRWFESNLLNSTRALKNFSSKIFQALLLNLHNLYHHQQHHHHFSLSVSDERQVSQSAKQLLILIFDRHPQRLKEIILLLNRQLRKQKNQFYLFESQNLAFSKSLVKSRQLPIMQDQVAQVLWGNNVRFLSQVSNKMLKQVELNQEQLDQLYAPIFPHSKSSVNLVYLIQVATIGLRHVDDINKNEQLQQLLYRFLCSLLNSMRVSQNDIQFQYLYKLSQQLKLLFTSLIEKNEQIIYSFFKFCFKYLLKQNGDQVWVEILIMIIVISAVIQNHKGNKDKKRLEKLQWFKDDLLNIINRDQFTAKDIYELYQENKSLFDVSLRISARLQSIKFKTLQHLQNKSPAQIQVKSLSNIQDSVISSKMQVSQSNPDKDFVNVFKIVSKE